MKRKKDMPPTEKRKEMKRKKDMPPTKKRKEKIRKEKICHPQRKEKKKKYMPQLDPVLESYRQQVYLLQYKLSPPSLEDSLFTVEGAKLKIILKLLLRAHGVPCF